MVWEKHPMWYMVFTIARKWRFIFAKSKHIFYNKFKDGEKMGQHILQVDCNSFYALVEQGSQS